MSEPMTRAFNNYFASGFPVSGIPGDVARLYGRMLAEAGYMPIAEQIVGQDDHVTVGELTASMPIDSTDGGEQRPADTITGPYYKLLDDGRELCVLGLMLWRKTISPSTST